MISNVNFDSNLKMRLLFFNKPELHVQTSVALQGGHLLKPDIL